MSIDTGYRPQGPDLQFLTDLTRPRREITPILTPRLDETSSHRHLQITLTSPRHLVSIDTGHRPQGPDLELRTCPGRCRVRSLVGTSGRAGPPPHPLRLKCLDRPG